MIIPHFPSPAEAISLIQHHGYLVFFLLAIIEGPIVTIIGAFLVSIGYFHLIPLYVLAVLGDLTGDLIHYAIGAQSKKRFATKGSLFGISKDRIIKIENHFGDHGGKTIFFGKISHSLGFAILIAAGLVGMPIGEFLLFNLLGTLPKTLVLMAIGYYFGSAYQSIDSYITYIGVGLFFILVIGIAVWFIRKKEPIDE